MQTLQEYIYLFIYFHLLNLQRQGFLTPRTAAKIILYLVPSHFSDTNYYFSFILKLFFNFLI